MKFTDVFIKRPVLTTVVGLLILLAGLQASSSLPVRDLPKFTNTVITVTTVYPGVPQELIQSLVTKPIQTALAGTEGIDYLRSSSVPGESQISARIEPDYDANAALAQIMSKLAGLKQELPTNAHKPVVRKQTGSEIAPFYVGFHSNTMNAEQITDYVRRVVMPLFETVPGVAEIDQFGASTRAIRVWLNPQAMAAREITPQQVFAALRDNHYQAVVAGIEGRFTVASITVPAALDELKSLESLVLAQSGNTLVRLQEIGKVEAGSRDDGSKVFVRGRPAVALQVRPSEDADPVAVMAELKQVLPDLAQEMPEGLDYEILLDQTTQIQDSLDALSLSILLTMAIVLLVIFSLTGSARAVIVPLTCILLSLLGSMAFMQSTGFSLNRLTLLAMLVAVGLVADDAIVVIEGVRRHIEEGRSPFEAAMLAARELAAPLLVMTLGVAAVFVPLALLTRPFGALWSELAFTLIASVVLSGVLALTLAPMMSSRLLKTDDNGWPQGLTDRVLGKVRARYERALDDVLLHRPVVLSLAVVALASIPILLRHTAVELLPAEDQGVVMGQGIAPMHASLDDTVKSSQDAAKLFEDLAENELSFSIAGFRGSNTALIATHLKPRAERKRVQDDIRMALQRDLQSVPGMEFDTFLIPPLPGSEMGLPVQLVITGQAKGYDETYKLMTAIQAKAKESGKFYVIDHSLRMSKPQMALEVKRDLAASLGISMLEIGQALSLAFGDSQIDYVDMEGHSYPVMTQVAPEFRLSTDMVDQVYVPTHQGMLVPLGTVVELSKTVQPSALQQFNRRSSATIGLLPFPWVSMSEAVAFAEDAAKQVLPEGFSYDFIGESRQYVQQARTLVRAFLYAVALIFLLLAAKLESWRDALVVLLTVPMALCGALICMQAGASTLNVYSEIGLLALLGLLSKHGMLFVETANELQAQQGLTKMEAILGASAMRLRPVLITSCAIVLAMIPLLLSAGAAAEAHRSLGWPLFAGLAIGSWFTLFVLPVMYSYISKPKAPVVEAPPLPPPASRQDDDTPAARLMSATMRDDRI